MQKPILSSLFLAVLFLVCYCENSLSSCELCWILNYLSPSIVNQYKPGMKQLIASNPSLLFFCLLKATSYHLPYFTLNFSNQSLRDYVQSEISPIEHASSLI